MAARAGGDVSVEEVDLAEVERNVDKLARRFLGMSGSDFMTYRANGKQYVIVVAGGHGSAGTKLGDSVVAYSLPVPSAE